jgi:hypothetical protein
MGTEEVKSLMESVVRMMKGQGVVEEDAEKVNSNIAELTAIMEKVEIAVNDGLQLSDITVIGEVVPYIMKLAAGFKDYQGEDKKRFVQEVVWLVYRSIDTMPDGKRNNIDVPWVGGIFERKVERAVVTFAAGMAVDAVYSRMKKTGEV